MIKIHNLRKHYPSKQGPQLGLDGIDLHIAKGSIFGIIGKSGAGKSTLVRCMNRLETPDQGRIEIDGTDILALRAKSLRQQRQQIGMVFQHFNLMSSKTVFDNIALPLMFTGVSRADMTNKIKPLLKLTGLSDKALAYPAQLSGGQKQRVAIARALVSEPKVLLCDEPTSALDPDTTNNILQLLSTINQQLGLTIVIIAHDLHVIKSICDHVAILGHGKIIEQGTVLDTISQPKHNTTRAFMKTAMRLELPSHISDMLTTKTGPNHHPLLRFGFVGKDTATPFLSDMTQRWQIRFSILQAHIELIQNQPVGFMTVQAYADDTQLQNIMAHTKHHGFNVEVLGYVH